MSPARTTEPLRIWYTDGITYSAPVTPIRASIRSAMPTGAITRHASASARRTRWTRALRTRRASGPGLARESPWHGQLDKHNSRLQRRRRLEPRWWNSRADGDQGDPASVSAVFHSAAPAAAGARRATLPVGAHVSKAQEGAETGHCGGIGPYRWPIENRQGARASCPAASLSPLPLPTFVSDA
jgi:hypothetical protein